MTPSGSLQPTSAGVPRTPPDISGAPEPRHAHSPTLADAAGRLARGELTVDEFWRTTGLRRPLVEPDPADPSARIVTFLWRDPDAEHVYVGVNKVTHGPEQGAMTRLAGTDIWYLSVVLDARWRGTYGFVPLDADSWRDLVDTGARPAIRLLRESTVPDPGNPLVELSHLGDPLSVAELDLAPTQPWLTAPGGAGRSVRRPPEPVQGPAGRTLWVTTPRTTAPNRRRMHLYCWSWTERSGSAEATSWTRSPPSPRPGASVHPWWSTSTTARPSGA